MLFQSYTHCAGHTGRVALWGYCSVGGMIEGGMVVGGMVVDGMVVGGVW